MMRFRSNAGPAGRQATVESLNEFHNEVTIFNQGKTWKEDVFVGDNMSLYFQSQFTTNVCHSAFM